MLKKKDHT